jgi:hypothetical protein
MERKILLLIAALGLSFAVYVTYIISDECNAKGSTLVRGVVFFTCVQSVK